MAVVKTQPSQLSGHSCGLPTAPKYVIDGPIEWVVRLETRQDHARLPPDHRNEMAKLIGNAPGNPTDRLHLLRLMQLLLKAFSFLLLLPDMLIRSRQIALQTLDTNLQLIARCLQGPLSFFQSLNTPQQLCFLLPFD